MTTHGFDVLGADAEWVRNKFRAPELDASTGLPDEEISTQMLEMARGELKDAPPAVAKAKLSAFMADNTQIAVSEHDTFPAFGC